MRFKGFNLDATVSLWKSCGNPVENPVEISGSWTPPLPPLPPPHLEHYHRLEVIIVSRLAALAFLLPFPFYWLRQKASRLLSARLGSTISPPLMGSPRK